MNEPQVRKEPPVRTTFTVLAEVAKEMGGEQMKQAFLRDMGGYAKANMVEKPLSEEEYQHQLKQMHAEIHAFRQFLSLS